MVRSRFFLSYPLPFRAGFRTSAKKDPPSLGGERKSLVFMEVTFGGPHDVMNILCDEVTILVLMEVTFGGFAPRFKSADVTLSQSLF